MRADRSVLWAGVALVAILAGFALGGLMLLPTADRAELVRSAGSVVAPALVSLLAAAIAGISAWTARQSHQETKAQNVTLDTIKTNTNGNLTEAKRRADLAEAALAELRAQSQGGPTVDVVPAGDPVEPASVYIREPVPS